MIISKMSEVEFAGDATLGLAKIHIALHGNK